MFKKILTYTALALTVCYIVFAVFFVSGKDDDNTCKDIKVNIKENRDMLSKASIISLLQNEDLDPTGKLLNKVKCFKIERYISGLSIIRDCQAYKTNDGDVILEINCRRPILAVQDKEGKQYCIDSVGTIIEGVSKLLYLPVATGNIVDSMATSELKDVANAINNDTFWKAQTEQIYFDQKRNIILVPRIGGHIVKLGSADSIKVKLDKVKTFYIKGLNTIGWNTYSILDAEFDDRIIGTRRE
jgi:cell division protein FtsQ